MLFFDLHKICPAHAPQLIIISLLHGQQFRSDSSLGNVLTMIAVRLFADVYNIIIITFFENATIQSVIEIVKTKEK